MDIYSSVDLGGLESALHACSSQPCLGCISLHSRDVYPLQEQDMGRENKKGESLGMSVDGYENRM